MNNHVITPEYIKERIDHLRELSREKQEYEAQQEKEQFVQQPMQVVEITSKSDYK